MDIKMLIKKNKKFRKTGLIILDVDPSVALKRIEYRKRKNLSSWNS